MTESDGRYSDHDRGPSAMHPDDLIVGVKGDPVRAAQRLRDPS